MTGNMKKGKEKQDEQISEFSYLAYNPGISRKKGFDLTVLIIH